MNATIQRRALPLGDGGAQWVLGSYSRREARARAAAICVGPRWAVCVTPTVLRPMRERCAALGHPAEQCVCWRHGEDWYAPCAPDAPGAIAAWRIDQPAPGAWRRVLNAARERVRAARDARAR